MADLARKILIGGRYELEEQLGRGGMGEVWRARHVALNNHFALKFLHRASAQRDITRKRFETEAQVTAQLKTRHAVQVFDFGITDEGQPYLVMELLDGETVGHRLERLKRLAVPTTGRFLAQASRALERAHALGIVHRDFKPDNLVIALDEDGGEYIKVLDFGIAKILGELEAEPGEEDPTLVGAHQSFTRTGSILGTPYYMAPEQIRNARDIDARADIWAFGVVAFECLVGVPPFDGKDVYELFDRIQTGTHARAHELNPDVPREFDTWFDIACAVDTTLRFANAKVAAAHLALALGEGGDLDARSAEGRAERTSESQPVPERANLAHAATLEQTHGGKVLSRKRRSVGGSATSLPLVRVAKDAEQEHPGETSPAATAKSDRVPPAAAETSFVQVRSRRLASRWIVIALAGLAGGATAFWLQPFTPHKRPANVTATSAPPPLPPTPPAMLGNPVDQEALVAIPPSASVATTPTARPAAASASPIVATPAPRKAVASAAPSASIAPVTSVPPAAVTAPATPAPSKSARSPFELPPLGI